MLLDAGPGRYMPHTRAYSCGLEISRYWSIGIKRKRANIGTSCVVAFSSLPRFNGINIRRTWLGPLSVRYVSRPCTRIIRWMIGCTHTMDARAHANMGSACRTPAIHVSLYSPMLPFARSDRISLKPLRAFICSCRCVHACPRGWHPCRYGNGKRYPHPGLWYLILIAAHSVPSSPSLEYLLPSPRACLRYVIHYRKLFLTPATSAGLFCPHDGGVAPANVAPTKRPPPRFSNIDSRRGKNGRANWNRFGVRGIFFQIAFFNHLDCRDHTRAIICTRWASVRCAAFPLAHARNACFSFFNSRNTWVIFSV